jgi:hypothetical protein
LRPFKGEGQERNWVGDLCSGCENESPPSEEGGYRELAQVAPIVQFVGVFGPAVADVGAVVHVGNEDVFDA